MFNGRLKLTEDGNSHANDTMVTPTSQFDNHSVGQSTFSKGLKAQFEWLFVPASAVVSPTDGEDGSFFRSLQQQNDTTWRREKHQDILDCLAGYASNNGNAFPQGINSTSSMTSNSPSSSSSAMTVDLWKLRELALSRGGLLCPDVRKRAWPTLLSCHEQVLRQQSKLWSVDEKSGLEQIVEMSPEDMAALRHDVKHIIWNIEEHLAASQEQRKLQDERFRSFLEQQRGRKRVKFATPTTTMMIGPGDCPPKTIMASPLSDTEDEDDPSILTQDGTHDVDDTTVVTEGSSFSHSSRAVRWRKSTRDEQKILLNVISSVLRTKPPDNAIQADAFNTDERYHFYGGLQDLAALLMINVESPSLTNLVLEKLAPCHLRDALRKDRALDTLVSHTFMPLLEMVDSRLHRHLIKTGITLPSFCLQWISCWFAQDVPDVRVASRLIDVLLVSHPVMPVYLSVAMLNTQRNRIFGADQTLSSLYSLLRGLPMKATEHQSEEDVCDEKLMEDVEEMIATAISYMERFPPSVLAGIAKNRADDPKESEILSAVAMLQEPPGWSRAARAPNDWALLQRTKELRMQSKNGALPEDNKLVRLDDVAKDELLLTDYPLAVAAAGRSLVPKNRGNIYLFLFFVLCLSLCIFVSYPSVSGTSSFGWMQPPQDGLTNYKPPSHVTHLASSSSLQEIAPKSHMFCEKPHKKLFKSKPTSASYRLCSKSQNKKHVQSKSNRTVLQPRVKLDLSALPLSAPSSKQQHQPPVAEPSILPVVLHNDQQLEEKTVRGATVNFTSPRKVLFRLKKQLERFQVFWKKLWLAFTGWRNREKKGET